MEADGHFNVMSFAMSYHFNVISFEMEVTMCLQRKKQRKADEKEGVK